MKKTDEAIVEEISDYMHGYLKDGKVSLQSFFSKMNIDIMNMQDLLKIRFLLLPETIEFVQNLKTNIQTIKTTTIAEKSTHYGEIRGQIDWAETTKERLRRNYKDKTIFSVSESVRSYNTPENLMLKELLRILYGLLFEDVVIKSIKHRRWYVEWHVLKQVVAKVYLKNIYMERIDTNSLSYRMLTKILRHRNPFYREAAKLLITYRQMMKGVYDKEDLQNVLSKTLIIPENRDVLFELYWIVQLMKANSTKHKLHLLDGTKNIVASWADEDHTYLLYHDSIGSQNGRFLIKLNEIADSTNPYLARKYQATTSYHALAFKVFGENKSDSFWSGRPDFLLEIREISTNKLVQVVIGEVKNSSNPAYASEGLRELLDYIYLMKDEKGIYVNGNQVKVSGMLCLRDVTFNTEVGNSLVKIFNMESDILELSI